MPIARIELFPGRSPKLKHEIAAGVTRLLEKTAGIQPSTTTVVLQETLPQAWFVAGRSYAAAAVSAPNTSV